jgi:hypothetical protein
MNRSYLWVVAALLASVTLYGQAAEDITLADPDKQSLPWEKGSIKIGGFFAAFNSELGFGVNDAEATLDAEDLLGLDSNLTVFRVEALFRPGASRRHQLDFSYASYDRDGSKTLSRDIIVNDMTIPAGTEIESVFDFHIIRGTYSYAFLQGEKMRIALGLGIYAVPVRYGLSYETTEGRTAVHGGDTTLPLPAVALRGDFQLLPKLFLGAAVDGMYLEVSDFKGWLADANLSLEYRPWKHFGFGVGYNALSVFLEVDDSSSNYPGADFVGTVDVHFNGVMFYGKFSF